MCNEFVKFYRRPYIYAETHLPSGAHSWTQLHCFVHWNLQLTTLVAGLKMSKSSSSVNAPRHARRVLLDLKPASTSSWCRKNWRINLFDWECLCVFLGWGIFCTFDFSQLITDDGNIWMLPCLFLTSPSHFVWLMIPRYKHSSHYIHFSWFSDLFWA